MEESSNEEFEGDVGSEINISSFFVQMKQCVIDANSSLEQMEEETSPERSVKVTPISQVFSASSSYDNRITEVQKTFDEKLLQLQFERDNYEREILELKSRRELNIDTDREKEERIRSLNQQVSSLQKQKDVLERQFSNFQNERKEFTQKYSCLKSQMNDLISHIQTFEQTVELLECHQQKIHDSCSSFEDSLRKASESNTQYQAQISQMRKKNAFLQTEVIELEYSVKHIKNERDLAKQGEVKARSHIEEFLALKKNEKPENNNERDILSYLQKSTNEVTKLEIKIKELQKKNLENKKIHELRLKSLQQKCSKLVMEQWEYKENKEKENLRILNEREKLSLSVDNLKEKCKNSENQLQQSRNKEIQNLQETEKLKDTLKQVEFQNSQNSEKLKNLEAELSSAEKKNNDLSSRNDKIVKEMENLMIEKKSKDEKILKLKLLLDEIQQKLKFNENSYSRSNSNSSTSIFSNNFNSNMKNNSSSSGLTRRSPNSNFQKPRIPKPSLPSLPDFILPKRKIPTLPNPSKEMNGQKNNSSLSLPSRNNNSHSEILSNNPKIPKRRISVTEFLATLKNTSNSKLPKQTSQSKVKNKTLFSESTKIHRPPSPPTSKFSFSGTIGTSSKKKSVKSKNPLSSDLPISLNMKKKKKSEKSSSCGICGKELYGYLVRCVDCGKSYHGHCVGEDFGDYICDLCTVKKNSKIKSKQSNLNSSSSSGTRKRKIRSYGLGQISLSSNNPPKKKKRKILKKLSFTLD